MQYHVNGEIVPASEASVSVADRGFLYGDAVFETLRAYGGTPFAWDAHRERLQHSAERLGFADAVPDDLRARVDETLAANDCPEAYVRLSVTRGQSPGRLTPPASVDPTVVVLVEPLPRGGLEGERVWDDPATIQTVRTRRAPDAALPADAKTHNYLNGIMGRLELRDAVPTENGDDTAQRSDDAAQSGDDLAERVGEPADECLLRDVEGALLEGATSNVFFVDDGGLHTPAADRDLLPGITRATVLELAEDEDGIPVTTGRYEPSDVRRADEAFCTNTTWEIRPIETVDGVTVGGGPVTTLLQRLYDERVEHEHYA